MVDVVSGWSDNNRVYLVERRADDIKIRMMPARWSFFVEGLGAAELASLAREPRVKAISEDGERRHRIDFKNRWGRRDIADALEAYAVKNERPIKVLEADVNPLRRLLSDVPAIDVSQSPRLGYFDLETDSRKPIRLHLEGEARILSWAIGDIDGVEGVVLEADTDAAELELLEAFFIAAERFDTLIAWYGSGYDFETLQNRCNVLELRVRGRRPMWHRWAWLDQLVVFKKYNMHSDDGGEAKTSYALDHVAGYLLGEGKISFDASKTWEAWEAGGERRAELLAYNIRDVELLPRIEAKTGFLDLHLAVCHICRVFPDTQSLNATQQGDGFLLRLGDEHGHRWATKKHVEIDEPFAGAYVMPPTRTGAIDNVHVCDFSGLYPSIIRTWNMSPDTKVSDFPDEPPCADLSSQGVCQLPGRSTFFSTDRDGMFRIALDTLVAKRAEYQAEMKKHTPGSPEHGRAKKLQAAFKIVANSFYGILGSPYSRFADREIAEGVTATGQWLLKCVIAEAKTRGLDPFYGDTDSVFIAGDTADMRELVSHMNETWSSRVREFGIVAGQPMHIDLDFEKTFSRLVLISAKRYAGRFLMYKGKAADRSAAPEVKGLEFKRGDTIRLAREMQIEVINELLADGPLPSSSTARAIVAKWKRKIFDEELDLDAVVLSQSLSKPLSGYVQSFTKPKCECGHIFTAKIDAKGPERCPQCKEERKRRSPPRHIKVAHVLAARGVEIKEGDRIRYLIAEIPPDAKGKMGTEAVPVSDEAFARIDRAYYWERTYKASARVLAKVYPSEGWELTTAEKRERSKARARVYNKDKIDDLPLFAGLESTSTDAPRRSAWAPSPDPDPDPIGEAIDTVHRRAFPHACHIPGCDVEVPPKMLMCRAHWCRVPRALQRAVWQHFKPRQCIAGSNTSPTIEWHNAADAAIDAVLELEGRPRSGKRPRRRKVQPPPPAPETPAEAPQKGRPRRRKLGSGASRRKKVERSPQPRRRKVEAPPPPPAKKGKIRRRKRQKIEASPVLVYRMWECTDIANGGAEQYRRTVVIDCLTKAAALHPGAVPVRIDVWWIRAITGDRQFKISIPLEIGVADTPEARAAFAALVKDSRIETVNWIAA